MLEGIRVLQLGGEVADLAGKILGDLGADVIRIEAPGGAPERRAPFLGEQADLGEQAHPGEQADPEGSLAWLALNTSKRGITLCLEGPEGRALLQRLLGRADVLLDGFSAQRLAELELGWEALHRAHPGLVHCSLSPFGQTGPYADYSGQDLVVVAMGGNLALTGDADRPPLRCSMPTAYFHAAPEAALGTVMALHAREQDGLGQRVDVSLQECQLQTLLGTLSPQPRRRSGARTGPTREIWRTQDGWVSFGLRGGAARAANLAATVDWMHESGMAPEWLRATDWERFDPRQLGGEEIARLEEAFGAFFRCHSMGELYEEALRRRILLAPCNDAREILAHRQLRERELFVSLELPELGARIEHPDFFARTEDRAIRIRRRAPRVGEHNAELYAEIGVDADELARLCAGGVV